MQRNPCHKTDSIGSKYPEKTPIIEAKDFFVLVEVFKTSNKHAMYAYYTTIFLTGLRPCEALGLHFEDVNIEQGTVTIARSYQRRKGEDVEYAPKTKASARCIALSPSNVEILADYISSIYKPDKDDRVFPYTKSYVDGQLKWAFRESGLKRITQGKFRASHTTFCLEHGFPIHEVSERLGHTRSATTLEFYSRVMKSKQTELANSLDSILEQYKPEDTECQD